ncbi:MAG: SLBB domain-containing protein [Nitrospirae bacterium]|nr:SLBB domain-containing protein [Nitrospirota bacterium]
MFGSCAGAVRKPPDLLPLAAQPLPTAGAQPVESAPAPGRDLAGATQGPDDGSVRRSRSGAEGATWAEISSFQKATRRGAAEYVLYKEDVIEVEVAGYAEFSGDFVVLADGNVAVPFGPSIQAEGVTLDVFRENWERAIRRYVAKPKISVAIKKAGQRMVTVMGDVSKAGRTPILGQGTLLEVLMSAGWNYDATLAQNVSIIRGGTSIQFPLGRLFGTSEFKYNLSVQPDDILIVGSPGPVRVHGAVAKPAVFPVGSRGWLSVREVVTQAGGLTIGASLSEATVVRKTGEELRVDLNTELFLPGAAPSARLEPGDTLYIPHSQEVGVYVLGMVTRPGLYRQPGRITAMQALALADQAKFGAVLSSTKVVRHYGSADQQVIALNLDRVVSKGDLRQDLELNNGDVLFVPESTTSDALDFLGRLLTPLSAGAGVASQVRILQQ